MKRAISIFTVTLFMVGAIAAFIAGASGTANAMGWSCNWANTKLAKEDGLREARGVFQNGKFSEITVTGSSVSGNRGAYTAVIRIIPEKQMVFIVVMGPDAKDCEKLASYLKANAIW